MRGSKYNNFLKSIHSPSALKSSSKFSEDFIFHFPEKSVTLFSISVQALAEINIIGLSADYKPIVVAVTVSLYVCPPAFTGW